MFLVCHVHTQPFADPDENFAQFHSQLGILLVLFSGILLRANVGSDDPYESTMITIVIVGSQVWVFLLFVFFILADAQLQMRRCCSVVDATAQTALQELDEYMDEILCEVEEAVEAFKQSNQVPPEICSVLLEIVRSYRSGNLGQFNTPVRRYATMLVDELCAVNFRKGRKSSLSSCLQASGTQQHA